MYFLGLIWFSIYCPFRIGVDYRLTVSPRLTKAKNSDGTHRGGCVIVLPDGGVINKTASSEDMQQ